MGLLDKVKKYNPLKVGYDWMWGDPAKAQKQGLTEVGDKARQQGQGEMDAANNIGMSAKKEFGTADATWGSLYGPGGSLSTPGALEKLYADRATGTSAAYKNTLDTGLAGLRQGAVARGKFSGTGAQAAEGKFAAETAANEARDQAGLAQAAQNAQIQRLTGGLSSATGLGSLKSGITTSTGLAGLQLKSSADYYALDAELSKLNIDPMVRQQILNLGLGALKAGAQAAGGARG